MFGRQSSRLVRESWNDTGELAQELQAMFQDGVPLQHDANVKITNSNAKSSALTVVHNNEGQDVLRVEDPYGNLLGGLHLINGDLVMRSYSRGKNYSTYPGMKDVISQFPDPIKVQDDFSGDSSTSGTTVYPGRVTAAASPTNYTVLAYPDGFGSIGTAVSVSASLSAGSVALAVGSYCFVCLAGSTYYIIQDPRLTQGLSYVALLGAQVGSTQYYNVTLYPNGITNPGTAAVALNVTSAVMTNVNYVNVIQTSDGNLYFVQYERFM